MESTDTTEVKKTNLKPVAMKGYDEAVAKLNEKNIMVTPSIKWACDWADLHAAARITNKTETNICKVKIPLLVSMGWATDNLFIIKTTKDTYLIHGSNVKNSHFI